MMWRAYLEKRPWDGTQNLRLIRDRGDTFDMVLPFTLRSYPRGSAVPLDEVTLSTNLYSITGEEIQSFLRAIVNLAWDEGIKPVQLEDQRNELKAVRDHLADMRALAMK